VLCFCFETTNQKIGGMKIADFWSMMTGDWLFEMTDCAENY